MAAGFKAMEALLTFFQHISFGSIVGVLLFSSIFMLTILAINLVNNNYPDNPVEGRQKKVFNRLFLLNFVFLTFLFGFIIIEVREIKQLAMVSGKNFFDFSFSIFVLLLLYTSMLILQLVILFGLYKLRLELYENFMNRKFEFERN
ncbi:hypothetical protein [Terrimonas pollutisoli]|uniref:hypothetical protein n=1 Tax=Terrimonas pollutisoli TaxID=3034147 RepID=UPI0023ED2190|nr:hypothetical protein [Terrimonas sp. H1YJ31]